MRNIITSLLLCLGSAIGFSQAGPQIQTGGANGQIQWPSGCTSGLVYSPSSNSCVSASGSALPFSTTTVGGGVCGVGDSTLPGDVLTGSTTSNMLAAYGGLGCNPTAGTNHEYPGTYYTNGTPSSGDSACLDAMQIQLYPNLTGGQPDTGGFDWYSQCGVGDLLNNGSSLPPWGTITQPLVSAAGAINAMANWVGVPSKGKIFPNSAQCTLSGTGWTTTTAYGIPMYSGATGATLNCTTAWNFQGAMYMMKQVTNNGTATATLVVDLVTQPTVTTNDVGTLNTVHFSDMIFGQRFPILGAGTHTISLTVTNGPFNLFYFSFPNPTNGWQGLVPGKYVVSGLQYYDTNPTDGLGLDTAEKTASNQLAADGLDVTFANIRGAWPESTGNTTAFYEFSGSGTYPDGTACPIGSSAPHFGPCGHTMDTYQYLRTFNKVPTRGAYAKNFTSSDNSISINQANPSIVNLKLNSGGSMVWENTWSGTSAYAVGNTVAYNGTIYVNKLAISAPSPAAFVQAKSWTNANSVVTNSPVTVGDALYITMYCRSASGPGTGSCAAPTDSQGNTWNLLTNTTLGANNNYAELFSTTATATGALTINTPVVSSGTNVIFAEWVNTSATASHTFQNAWFGAGAQTCNPTITLTGASLMLYWGAVYSSPVSPATPVTTTATGGLISGAMLSYEAPSAGSYNPGVNLSNGEDSCLVGTFPVTAVNTTPDLDTTHWQAAAPNAGTTTNPLTMNNSGTGAASGTTFDGSVARTISYNTLGAAPLASPTFTGTPAAPTATHGTNTTQIATTAFVQDAVSGGGGGTTVSTFTCADTSGSPTAQSCTASPTLSSLAVNTCIAYTTTTANTGALTINVSSLGAKSVVKWLGTALAAGDMPANKSETLCYDGTNWNAMTIGNAPSGGGSGGGLFSQVMSALPTISGLGLTTSYHQQGSFAATNVAVGISLTDSTGLGNTDNVEGIVKAYPTPPFQFTVLMATSGTFGSSNPSSQGIMVSNDTTTGKLVLCGTANGSNNNNSAVLNFASYNSFSSFNAQTTLGTYSYNVPIWIRWKDDGTNYFCQYSMDGVNFLNLITGAKSGSWLGSSGYNFMGLFINPHNTTNATTTFFSAQ